MYKILLTTISVVFIATAAMAVKPDNPGKPDTGDAGGTPGACLGDPPVYKGPAGGTCDP